MSLKETKKHELDDEELDGVTGGYIGPNHYSMHEYHEAGLLTDWALVKHADMCALHAGEGNIWGNWMSCSSSNKYVEYYKTHTKEEYVNWIKKEYPNYSYNRGYDVS